MIQVCEFLTLRTTTEVNDWEFSDYTVPQLFEILNLILVHDPLLLNRPEDSATPSVNEILPASLGSALEHLGEVLEDRSLIVRH